MAEQRKISHAHGQAQHGSKLYVLAEKLADKKDLKGANIHSWEHGLIRETTRKSARLKGSQYTLARGEADAPDIDGRVYVQGEMPLGDFCWVRVIDHTDYDLIAERM